MILLHRIVSAVHDINCEESVACVNIMKFPVFFVMALFWFIAFSADIELGYVFYEDYVDLCHPNHPDCVTGVTCDDYSDGFNPMLDVACNLVVFSQEPLITAVPKLSDPEVNFDIKPNPSSGQVEISAHGYVSCESSTISLMTLTGIMVDRFNWDGVSARLDLSSHPRGVYILMIQTPNETEMKKIILQ
jgi:hypothetical protein